MREYALQYLAQKDYSNLFNLLKNNDIFNELMNDSIFKQIFSTNFDDLFHSENDPEIHIGILYSFHISPNYKFELSKVEEEKVIKFLIDTTSNVKYAKLLPDYEPSKKIIFQYQEELRKKVRSNQKELERQNELKVVEQFSNNTSIIKSIFNSPQEKEFYLACKQVFDKEIIIPNASLTTIFNSKVIKEKYPQYFNYFLSASVDFIIVNPDTFIPTLFFELDSKTFHSKSKSMENDRTKNYLFNEFGKSLIRIEKNNLNQGIEEFTLFLRKKKAEYEN